jgi:hypothetical protein
MKNPHAEQDAFNRKLRAVAEQIKLAAGGRVCGDCVCYREGQCAEHLNLEGRPLVILYVTAPACSAYTKRVNTLRLVSDGKGSV